MADWVQIMDYTLLGWVHEAFSSGFWARVMPFVSFIGNWGMVWVFAACLLLCTRKYRLHGLAVLIALGVGFLIGNLLLKPLIARVRPVWPYATPALLFPGPKGFSFPSGHALSSFAAATVLTLADRRFGWLAFPLACLIALSRLALYVHFPSDVFAGAVLGALDGVCVHQLVAKFIPAKRAGEGRTPRPSR